jgi:hypothetical protein
MNLKLWLMAIGVLVPFLAQAQSGAHGGGGERLWQSIEGKLSVWLKANLKDGSLAKKLHLKENQVSAQDFANAYFETTEGDQKAAIEFFPKDKIDYLCKNSRNSTESLLACELATSSRPCINHPELNSIGCSEELFLFDQPSTQHPRSAEDQFAWVLHEHLFKRNWENKNSSLTTSDFPISKYIADFVQPVAKISYELSLNEMPAKIIGFTCTSNDYYWSTFGGGWVYVPLDQTMGEFKVDSSGDETIEMAAKNYKINLERSADGIRAWVELSANGQKSSAGGVTFPGNHIVLTLDYSDKSKDKPGIFFRGTGVYCDPFAKQY